MAKLATLCVLAVAASLAVVSAQVTPNPYAPDVAYSAVYDSHTDQWSVVQGCESNGPSWTACGTLDDGMFTTGWYTLNVRTNPAQPDARQAYGAGYLEGALTSGSMWDAWRTWANGTVYVWPDAQVRQFAETQDAWVRANAANPPASDSAAFWAHVALVYAQWDGLMAGYNAAVGADKVLAPDQWLAYQLEEEIGDMQSALGLVNPDTQGMTPAMEHCSSLVRVTPDGTQLFASHDTWSAFNSMLRVFKHFDFSFTGALVANAPGLGVSFSSFPGAIPSIDDYYVTSAALLVMETTNGVMNQTLYELYTTTRTVPYWVRVTVANRMASSGAEWMTAFGTYNSGTYNNQWIVVDTKRFTAAVPSAGTTAQLQPGTLWIGEQIPGYLVTADMTDALRGSGPGNPAPSSLDSPDDDDHDVAGAGYWGSYNIPYFPFVYNISGFPAFYEKYGDTYSWAHCARANIFRRDAPGVTDLASMQRLMRYNEWQTDSLSLQDSCRGISARCDLNPPWVVNSLNPYSAFGAIDSKISSASLAAFGGPRQSVAVSGPTWDSQSPFAWTAQWSGVLHYGQPTVFAFDWITQKPTRP